MEPEEEIKKLEAENEQLKTEKGDLTARNKELEANLATVGEVDKVKALEAESKTLKEKLAAMEETAHLEKVGEVIDLRVAAGLAEGKDRAGEVEKLKTLSGAALSQMKDDLTRVASVLEKSTEPTAKYDAETVKSAEQKIHDDLFGPKPTEEK